METLSKMGSDELNTWLLENDLPQEVVQSFKGLCSGNIFVVLGIFVKNDSRYNVQNVII